jgi:hypothetical protein
MEFKVSSLAYLDRRKVCCFKVERKPGAQGVESSVDITRASASARSIDEPQTDEKVRETRGPPNVFGQN